MLHGDAISAAPIKISRALHTTVDASYFRGRGGVFERKTLVGGRSALLYFVGVLRSHFPFMGFSLFVGVLRSAPSHCSEIERRKGSHKAL